MSSVSRRTLTDQVSEALLALIIDEELSAGDSLPSAGTLAKRFDVSSVVVREAVAQLAGRGILSRRQGREPVVTLPGSDNLTEILSMHGRQQNIPRADFLVCRAALEVEAAVLAARRGDSAGRAEVLQTPLTDLRNAKSQSEIVAADLALHLSIVDLSGNRALRVILVSLVDVISTEISLRTKGQDRSHRDASLRHHEDIVAAIVAGDAMRARLAMIAHFEVALPGFAESVA